MKRKFNPQMITLARNYRVINQKTLSKRLNIGAGTLSKIENDILPVYENDDLAKSICNVLNFPIEFFFQRFRVENFMCEIEHAMVNRQTEYIKNLG